jgi:hypothetical protein
VGALLHVIWDYSESQCTTRSESEPKPATVNVQFLSHFVMESWDGITRNSSSSVMGWDHKKFKFKCSG